MTEEKIAPEFWVVAFDETKYWEDKFLKEYQIKQIEQIYLFDNHQHTHPCSFQPSFLMVPIGFRFWLTDEAEAAVNRESLSNAAYEAIMSNNDASNGDYIDVFEPEKVPTDNAYRIGPAVYVGQLEEYLQDRIDYDELFESVFEHIRGNNPLA